MIKELNKGDYIEILYTNWRGEEGLRNVIVDKLLYGSNTYHPAPQFLLQGFDIDKKAMRTFAIKDVKEIFVWNSTGKSK